VIQARKQASFPLEPRLVLLTFQEILGQNLDRDFSSESGVPRSVDLAHSTRAER
jgi:hypothetical protein